MASFVSAGIRACIFSLVLLALQSCGGGEADSNATLTHAEAKSLDLQVSLQNNGVDESELETRLNALGFRRVDSYEADGLSYWSIEPLPTATQPDYVGLRFLPGLVAFKTPQNTSTSNAKSIPRASASVARASTTSTTPRTKAALKFFLSPPLRFDKPFICSFEEEFDSHEAVFNHCNQWMLQNSGGTAKVADQTPVNGSHFFEGFPKKTVFESYSLNGGIWKLQSGFEQYSQFSRAVCPDGKKVVEEVIDFAGGFNHTFWCEEESAKPKELPPETEEGGEQAGMCTPHPIIPASGEKSFHYSDVDDRTPHPLNFERTYRTQWQLAPQANMGAMWWS